VITLTGRVIAIEDGSEWIDGRRRVSVRLSDGASTIFSVVKFPNDTLQLGDMVRFTGHVFVPEPEPAPEPAPAPQRPEAVSRG